jgi:cobalt-zinc-cadmium efflux system protein
VTPDRRLILVVGINLVMVLALAIVGIVSHSLGVLAAGADYLGDAAAAGLSLAAIRIGRRSEGRSRATSFAALANGSFLLLVTVVVAVEAINRLATGTPNVHGAPVIVVSLIAAAAMVACALILGDVESDLSMQSVMLDTVADAAAAVGVAASATIILLTHGHYWLDSVFALVIAVVVGYHAVRLLLRVARNLRQEPSRIS